MKNQPKTARIFHFDLYGKREEKYDFLNNESLDSIPWKELDCPEPYCFFVPKDFGMKEEYERGFKIDQLFSINNSGVSTDRDSLFLDNDKKDLENRISILLSGNYPNGFKTLFNVENSSGYALLKRISHKVFNANFIRDYHYRPFDIRKIYFDDSIISRPAKDVSRQINDNNNLLFIAPRQVNEDFHHVFLSKIICDSNITSSARLFGAGKLFPLYQYPKTHEQQTIDQKTERIPNLNLQIVEQISEKFGLQFTPEKEATPGTFAPIDLLDYIYAVLHSPTYREKYKEFLKIDFPRVPYPKDVATFWHLAALGGELRQIHILESPVVKKYITKYPVGGSNVVEKVRFEDGNVFINDTQYFANVPEVAWKFYIGGYQPAQKWLKDRKGRELQFDDILHYQEIIVALSETGRLMTKIDEIVIE